MTHTASDNPALGTLLKLSIASVLTTVGLDLSLDGPSMEVGTRETTYLGSAAKTFKPTIPDGGEVSGTLLYDPQEPSHLAMFNLIWAPALSSWSMVFQDVGPTTFAFQGILTKFSPTGIEVESNLEAEFTIKVSGVVTEST